jgi:hypothetical protein
MARFIHPKPLKFTLYEGSGFILWPKTQCLDPDVLIQRNARFINFAGMTIHSIVFLNKEEWDCINGFR